MGENTQAGLQIGFGTVRHEIPIMDGLMSLSWGSISQHRVTEEHDLIVKAKNMRRQIRFALRNDTTLSGDDVDDLQEEILGLTHIANEWLEPELGSTHFECMVGSGVKVVSSVPCSMICLSGVIQLCVRGFSRDKEVMHNHINVLSGGYVRFMTPAPDTSRCVILTAYSPDVTLAAVSKVDVRFEGDVTDHNLGEMHG